MIQKQLTDYPTINQPKATLHPSTPLETNVPHLLLYFTHRCPLSSTPTSLPTCPSLQQLAQYKSPSHPTHRTVASSLQIAHQLSISSSVNCAFGLGCRSDNVTFTGFLAGEKVGAEGRVRDDVVAVGVGAEEGREVGVEGRLRAMGGSG